MTKMKMVAGLDIGNGYVKGRARVDGAKDTEVLDMPSVVAYTVGSNLPKDPTDAYMADFANEMDATMSSRGIKAKDEGRMLFGTRAIKSGAAACEFNIDNHVPKCSDSLSTILILGSVSAFALREFWAKHKALPTDTLEVEACIGVALPIEDYLDYKDIYRNMLVGENHYVHIHNFEQELTVKVTFSEVVVLAEGAAGQYALSALGADFLDAALDIARAQGAKIDDAYTGEVLLGAKNTIGIDIGEGTVNFPVFSNGDISVEASSSINKGYGTVLSDVVAALRNTSCSFDSRKSLADFMLQETYMPAQQHVRDAAQIQIDKQLGIFGREVEKEFSKTFGRVGLRTEVIYVYGGGANPSRDVLYPMLIEAATLDGGTCIPVVYLDSTFSRDLNRNGLFEAAELMSQVVESKKTTPMTGIVSEVVSEGVE